MNRAQHPLPPNTGIILVDHGSVKLEANAMLEAVALRYQEIVKAAIVEPAHMDLAEPTISQAFDRCVAQGAQTVVVMPYFLFPGRHSAEDIPRIVHQAAASHPGTRVLVSEPLGLDARILEVVHDRICAQLTTRQ